MLRNKSFIFVLLLILPRLTPAVESWLGLYMKGQKIGYSMTKDQPDQLDGQKCIRIESKTLMSANLMGQSMTMDMRSTTWTSAGKPKKMAIEVSSSGRKQTVIALFVGSQIKASIVNGGIKTTKTLSVPSDGQVVDDAVSSLITSKTPKTEMTYYVLDPITVSLVKNTAKRMGEENVTVNGKTTKAIRIDISEIRATTKVYLDSKANIIVAYGPLDIEMRPEPKAVAMKLGEGTTPDLADVSAVRPDHLITNAETVTTLKLRLVGKDLSKVPSGDHQTVTRDGDGWLMLVHPARVESETPIDQAAVGQAEWVKPSLDIPSNSAEFQKLAKQIVGDSKTVTEACDRIHAFVNQNMRPNAGIGVVRDATEVLKTKEGVCRDYAILTCTLTRAAGIPARLASGLIYQQGFFYYHAWIEAWNGGKWIGIDSTRMPNRMTATHLKLAEGNVDDAFVFTFLEHTKISVLRVDR